jgi:hypothetical protein
MPVAFEHWIATLKNKVYKEIHQNVYLNFGTQKGCYFAKIEDQYINRKDRFTVVSPLDKLAAFSSYVQGVSGLDASVFEVTAEHSSSPCYLFYFDDGMEEATSHLEICISIDEENMNIGWDFTGRMETCSERHSSFRQIIPTCISYVNHSPKHRLPLLLSPRPLWTEHQDLIRLFPELFSA